MGEVGEVGEEQPESKGHIYPPAGAIRQTHQNDRWAARITEPKGALAATASSLFLPNSTNCCLPVCTAAPARRLLLPPGLPHHVPALLPHATSCTPHPLTPHTQHPVVRWPPCPALP